MPTRRRFISNTISAFSLLGLSRAAMAESGEVEGVARRCVLLWMNGGPSQFETFDPKPGTTTGGPTTSIPTSVPGIKIAEHLPEIASRSEHYAIVRNLTSSEGEHERAQYYLHTGFQLVPAFPRPAIGSVVSHQLPESDLPKYVLLGAGGIGPAYCGPDHQAFTIEDAEASRQLLGRIEQREKDLEFLKELGKPFDDEHSKRVAAIARRRSMISRVGRLANTPLREALETAGESEPTRRRYGESQFGRRCLLARRLLERDVPFVEIQLDGWDTHTDNFNQVRRLAGPLDQAWSALTDDLQSSGLWQETLVVWMGDFGRTPVINGQAGRDHFPTVTPLVMGGGPIRGGQVIGKTNRGGTAIESDSVRVADVSATILQLLGIDPQQEFQTSFGSPTKATDEGKVIKLLVV